MPTASFNLINCEIDTSSKSKCDSQSIHASTTNPSTTGYLSTNPLAKMWSSDTVKTLSNTINSFKPQFLRLDSTGEDTSHSPVHVITKDVHRNNKKNFPNHQIENTACSSFNPTKLGFKNNFSCKSLTPNYSMKSATSVFNPLLQPENRNSVVMGSPNFIGTSHVPSLLGRYNKFTFVPSKSGKTPPYLHPDSPWLKVNSGYAQHMHGGRHCNSANIVEGMTPNDIPSKVHCMKNINQNNAHRKTHKHKHFQREKCSSPVQELNEIIRDSQKNGDIVTGNRIEETSSDKVQSKGSKLSNGLSQQCNSVIDQEKLEKTVLEATVSDSVVVQQPVVDVKASDEIKKTISLESNSDTAMVNTSEEKPHDNSQEEILLCFKNRNEPVMAATFAQSPSSSEWEDSDENFRNEENILNNSVNKSNSDNNVFDTSSNGIENTEITAEINGASKDSVTKTSSHSIKSDQKSCTVCTAYITRMTPECTDFPKSAGCRHSIILLVRDKSKKIKKHRPKEKHEKQPQSSDQSFIVDVKSASAGNTSIDSHVFTFVNSDTSDSDESWDSYDEEDAEDMKDFCNDSMEDFFPQTLMNPMNFRVQISTLPKPPSATNGKSSPTTSLIDSLNASWNIQIVDSKKIKDSKCPAKPPKERKVQFKNEDELVVVDGMCEWSYDDYQAARKGPWEQYARDRDRFRRRIQEVEEKISFVLGEKHRTKVFDTYFK